MSVDYEAYFPEVPTNNSSNALRVGVYIFGYAHVNKHVCGLIGIGLTSPCIPPSYLHYNYALHREHTCTYVPAATNAHIEHVHVWACCAALLASVPGLPHSVRALCA